MRRILLIVLLTVFSFSVIFAQTSPTESQSEKDKAAQELEKDALKLAQKSVSEAGSLKLWQNRALIFALAGDLFWKTEQKKARSLFRDAANELIAGSQVPKEKAKDYYQEYAWWEDTSPRRPVLLIIAAYDAELALEMLLETRPADLQVAIAEYNQPQPQTAAKKTQAQLVKEQAGKYKVQQEIQLEQQFAVKAAEQDPKKGAKLLRDSLAKGGFSQSIAELLGKINEKDESLGKELLAEVLSKLLDTDFKQKEDAVNLGIYFLRQSYSPETMKTQNPKFKQVKIEDRDLRALAVKFADFFVVNLDLTKYWRFSQISPMIEKYAPEKMPLLRQKEAEVKKVVPDEWESWQDVNRMITDQNTTPEKLLEESEKYAGYEKYMLYQAAVDRAVTAGTGDKIRTALQNLSESKQRSDALDYLDSKISDKALKDDKLDDVQQLIARSESANAKIKLLVNLAVGYQKKNTEESHKTALNFMNDARRLVGDVPESRKEAVDFLKIAAGYAEIEPASAFALLEPLIDMTNDMLTAYALLGKYNKSESMFRQGELIYMQSIGYGTPYLEFGKELKALAKFDFEKVENLTDRIRRDDMKILVRILLAQSILKEKITIEGIRQQYFDDEF